MTGRRGRDPKLIPPRGYRLWEREAACRSVDPELFFPPSHPESPSQRVAREAEARGVCASCPVLEQCRTLVDRMEAGVPARDWFGIWAGEDARERGRRRREESARLRVDEMHRWLAEHHAI